eukprot:GGOE01058298.1.p1 GENE.GGOE01058298.1~~GGOE01058298.1.p1  ORF type:complete len:663 (-),score=160.21 GGOE01058298.1:1112-2947(-)
MFATSKSSATQKEVKQQLRKGNNTTQAHVCISVVMEAIAPLWMAMQLSNKRQDRLEKEIALWQHQCSHGTQEAPDGPSAGEVSVDILDAWTSVENVLGMPPACHHANDDFEGALLQSTTSVCSNPFATMDPNPSVEGIGQRSSKLQPLDGAHAGKRSAELDSMAKALAVMQTTTEGLAGLLWDFQSTSALLTEDLALETQLRQEGQTRNAEVCTGLQVQVDDTVSSLRQLRQETEGMVCAALKQMCTFSSQLLTWSAALAKEKETLAQRLCTLQTQVDGLSVRQTDVSSDLLHDLSEKLTTFDCRLSAIQEASNRSNEGEDSGLLTRVDQLEAEVTQWQRIVPQVAALQEQYASTVRSAAVADVQWGRMENALQEVRAMIRDGLTQCTTAVDAILVANAKRDINVAELLAACEEKMANHFRAELELSAAGMAEAYSTKAELQAVVARQQATEEELQCEVQGCRDEVAGLAELHAAMQVQAECLATAGTTTAQQLDSTNTELRNVAAALAEVRGDLVLLHKTSEQHGRLIEGAVAELQDTNTALASSLATAREGEAELRGMVGNQSVTQAAVVEQLRGRLDEWHTTTDNRLAACFADLEVLKGNLSQLASGC